MYDEKCPIIFSAMRKIKKQETNYLSAGLKFFILRKESHFPANFFCFLIYSLFIFLQTTNCFNIFLYFVCLCTACFETKEAERQQICKIQEEKLSSSSLVKEKHEVGILRILIRVQKMNFCVCVFFVSFRY